MEAAVLNAGPGMQLAARNPLFKLLNPVRIQYAEQPGNNEETAGHSVSANHQRKGACLIA